DAFVVGGRLVLTEELLDLAVVAGEQLDRIGPRAGHRRRLCRHRYISLLFLGFASIGIASPTPSDATGSDVPPAPPLDPGPGGSPAARRWTMRPNSPAWTGTRRYQESRPTRPRGLNRARCCRRLPPAPSGSTVHSSQAWPGMRISLRRRSRRPGSSASTRQVSITSPTARRSGWRRPRRGPDPPARRSRTPRAVHSHDAPYQPRSPPMLVTARNTSAGGAGLRAVRRSSNTVPPDQGGSVGWGSAGVRRGSASNHDVRTSRSRQRRRASSTARRKGTGSWGTTASMLRSPTTASFTRLCTSGRASAGGSGVTSPIHNDDNQGERIGTVRMSRGGSPA